MKFLPGAKVRDLSGSRGNGPFGAFYGVILHVNASGKTSQGTPPDFYAAGTDRNPDSVTPNFQVMRDGTVWQLLPLDWQPWTQRDGNFHYASIETGGDPDEPLTDQQLAACARIVRAYHEQMGMPLRIANNPGERGLGTHGMGGAAWGGHTGCPGPIRSAQRKQILALASTNQTPDPLEEIVALDPNSADYKRLVADIAAAVWKADVIPAPAGADNAKSNPRWTPSSFLHFMYDNVSAIKKKVGA